MQHTYNTRAIIAQRRAAAATNDEAVELSFLDDLVLRGCPDYVDEFVERFTVAGRGWDGGVDERMAQRALSYAGLATQHRT